MEVMAMGDGFKPVKWPIMDYKLKNKSPYHLYKDGEEFIEVEAETITVALEKCEFKPNKIKRILNYVDGIIPKDMLAEKVIEKKLEAEAPQNDEQQSCGADISDTAEAKSEPEN